MQVWSNEIYEIEKFYKPLKVYSVYEYKLKGLKDKFREEELLKDVPKMIYQFEKKNKIIFYKNKNKRTGVITTRFHII